MILSYKYWLFDKLRLLAVLHPMRVLNYIFIFLGYFLSKILKKPIITAYPFSITFELSSFCNLHCPQCSVGRGETIRESRFIDKSFVFDILKRFKKRSFYLNLYLQGEPLLNKDIPMLVAKAKQEKYYTYVSTNGTLLTKELSLKIVNSGLDRLLISVDGTTQLSYSFYRRGGKLEQVLEGVKNIIEARKNLKKKNPVIIMQFLVNKQNEEEIKNLPSFAAQHNFDVLEIKSMQVYDNKAAYLPQQKKFNRYYKKKKSVKNKACFRLWSHLVFTSDGVNIPCCYDKIPTYAFAPQVNYDYNNWKSAEFQKFRKAVIRNRSNIDICNNCTE